MLAWQQALAKAPVPVAQAGTLFLYDPGTNKDLISDTIVGALKANTTVDTSVLIDGRSTIKFAAAASSGVTITLPTAINLDTLPAWTVEWVSRPTSFPTDYANELFLDTLTGITNVIGCRWSNLGYGNRLQFNMSNWANSFIWRPPVAKADVVNTIVRWAMVYQNNQVAIYKDGVRQMLANGTSTSTGTQNYIDKTMAFPTVARIHLGYYNGTNQSFLGNIGRIRISDGARYTANYTPIPF